MAAEDANMLVPRPGFPLYQVLCDYHGVEVRYYDLLASNNWEIDIDSLRSLVDDKTCALIVNNPSNPCCAVYSKTHLEKVMSFAQEAKLPIIADEVYSRMTFGDEPFIACASVSPHVPVLSVCAMSKRWLAPGWRMGWLTVHDNDEGILKKAEVPDTILKLCQVSLGPSAPLQAAIPSLLQHTPQEWYDRVNGHLREQAECCVRRVKSIPGLEVASEPKGAMYFMARIMPGAFAEPIGESDVAFAGALLQEESIVILPGACFEYPGYFRVVFAAPTHVLEEAWDRIEAFCRRRAASCASKEAV
jgi:tyrosine aminotransferase